MTAAEFEAAVMAEGFEKPVPVERLPGYALDDHAHPFDARALIVTGEITLVVGDVSTTYRAGEIFDLPAGTAHQEAAGPAGVMYLSGRRPVGA